VILSEREIVEAIAGGSGAESETSEGHETMSVGGREGSGIDAWGRENGNSLHQRMDWARATADGKEVKNGGVARPFHYLHLWFPNHHHAFLSLHRPSRLDHRHSHPDDLDPSPCLCHHLSFHGLLP
jgi:hypothetical protein